MKILELAQEIGLDPKRASSTHGGEYHSSCPRCGGKDRFVMWVSLGRYWCRQCGAKGDSIQFCRDYLNMNFQDACRRIGQESVILRQKAYFPNLQPKNTPPSALWMEKAKQLVTRCHQNLYHCPVACNHLYQRGLTKETIDRCLLGWNSSDQFLSMEEWGCSRGGPDKKKLWIPRGIIIPTIKQGSPIKLKVRRSAWNTSDHLPKYVEISGSQKDFAVYGDESREIAVIIESELDGILLQQVASDLCVSIALGGVGKKPSLEMHQFIRSHKCVLLSLDFDEAGKRAYTYWKTAYPKIIAWPISRGKSPGDGYQLGIDLRSWIIDGIEYAKLHL